MYPSSDRLPGADGDLPVTRENVIEHVARNGTGDTFGGKAEEPLMVVEARRRQGVLGGRQRANPPSELST